MSAKIANFGGIGYRWLIQENLINSFLWSLVIQYFRWGCFAPLACCAREQLPPLPPPPSYTTGRNCVHGVKKYPKFEYKLWKTSRSCITFTAYKRPDMTGFCYIDEKLQPRPVCGTLHDWGAPHKESRHQRGSNHKIPLRSSRPT